MEIKSCSQSEKHSSLVSKKIFFELHIKNMGTRLE